MKVHFFPFLYFIRFIFLYSSISPVVVWDLSVRVQDWGDSEASLQGGEGCIWTCSLGPGSGPGLYTTMKSGSKEWMLAARRAAAVGSHGPGGWGEGLQF